MATQITILNKAELTYLWAHFNFVVWIITWLLQTVYRWLFILSSFNICRSSVVQTGMTSESRGSSKTFFRCSKMKLKHLRYKLCHHPSVHWQQEGEVCYWHCFMPYLLHHRMNTTFTRVIWTSQLHTISLLNMLLFFLSFSYVPPDVIERIALPALHPTNRGRLRRRL